MIKPTVGRVVLFHPEDRVGSRPEQPWAGIVTFVHNDREVNLAVFDELGFHKARQHVVLLQDGDVAPPEAYCEWMPYQKGQAAKTEALEAKLKEPA